MLPLKLTSTIPYIISLVGGGGKTTTAFQLAKHFKQQGHSVLVTTTTKMFFPKSTDADTFIHFQESEQEKALAKLQQQVVSPSITFCFSELLLPLQSSSSSPQLPADLSQLDPETKVRGLSLDVISQLREKSPFSVIIVEADGAKQLPIKAPSRHEPCLPEYVDLVIGVTGADAILVKADPKQIHRWEIFSELTQCLEHQIIDEHILTGLINSPVGLFKHVPNHAKRIWVINKVDLTSSYPALKNTAKSVLSSSTQLDEIWLASMSSESPIIEVLKD